MDIFDFQPADNNANEIAKKLENAKIDDSGKGEEEKTGQRPTMRKKSMKKKKMTDSEIMDALGTSWKSMVIFLMSVND